MRSLTIFAVIFSVSLAFVVVQNTVVTQNNNIIECEGCKIAVKLIDDGVDLGIDAGIDVSSLDRSIMRPKRLEFGVTVPRGPS